MPAAIPYPEWISPAIIPGLPFRWYGLMYVVAITVVYFLFRWQVKSRKLDISSDDTLSFFFWGAIGLVIGARIFGTLVYNGSAEYWRKPWLIFWPFDSKTGKFGLMGMSFHGGLIGLLVGTFLFCKRKKKDFLAWWDLTAAGVPLGYTFGRLGNFINRELYGRVTDSPLGMYFWNTADLQKNASLLTSENCPLRLQGAYQSLLPGSKAITELADKVGAVGITLPSTGKDNLLYNLPRFPSQLFEAFFEGIVLWLVLWFIFRPRKPFKGFLVGAYLIGYGLVRFIIEYFRAPDLEIGYLKIFAGKKLTAPEDIALFQSPWAFSMGQLFCLLMMVLGGLVLYFLWKADKQDKLVASQAEKRSAKGLDRKLQKRIR